MEQVSQNKMETTPMHKLIWKMGLPMIVSMILQSVYNIVDTAFVINMGEGGDAIQAVVTTAIRIASIGYVFMAFSVAVQGVLQAFRYALFPLIISFLRLCLLVLPIAYLFTLSNDVLDIVWWTFPIVEFVTAIASALILKYAYKKKVRPMTN